MNFYQPFAGAEKFSKVKTLAWKGRLFSVKVLFNVLSGVWRHCTERLLLKSKGVIVGSTSFPTWVFSPVFVFRVVVSLPTLRCWAFPNSKEQTTEAYKWSNQQQGNWEATVCAPARRIWLCPCGPCRKSTFWVEPCGESQLQAKQYGMYSTERCIWGEIKHEHAVKPALFCYQKANSVFRWTMDWQNWAVGFTNKYKH